MTLNTFETSSYCLIFLFLVHCASLQARRLCKVRIDWGLSYSYEPYNKGSNYGEALQDFHPAFMPLKPCLKTLHNGIFAWAK